MEESDMSAWMSETAEERLEQLLRVVEAEIPADFVPIDEETMPASPRRRPKLEITITQRLAAPGRLLDENDPELVNHVTICIRPETPRSQAARERQWSELCEMRDSLREQLANLRSRKGIVDEPAAWLGKSAARH